MSLVHKYHPDVFERVLGQDRAVRTLVAQLRRDVPTPLLLCGPPGVGKTTLALIVARALNCLAHEPSGSPCLVCEKCVEFDTTDRTWFFLELNAGRLGGKDAAAYLDDVARAAPFGGARRRVIFVDEAHALSREAQDNLLDVLELLGAAAIILATNRPERLTPALRSRCITVPLDPVSTPTLIAYGRDICLQEKLDFEPDALAMLASAAQGQVRDFLLKLDEVSAQGRVTVVAAAAAVDGCGRCRRRSRVGGHCGDCADPTVGDGVGGRVRRVGDVGRTAWREGRGRAGCVGVCGAACGGSRRAVSDERRLSRGIAAGCR